MREHEGPDFELFAATELPGLLGFAHALTGSRHDAWALTQETLARLGLRWARLAGTGDPAGDARTTMVRLNIDRLRRLRREGPVANLPELFTEAATPETFDPWLVAALDVLTPRQRTAIVLRHVADLDLAGIGHEMNCSVRTATSHLSRGMDRLSGHPSSDLIVPDEEGAPPYG